MSSGSRSLRLGLDFGSVALKALLLDDAGNVVSRCYQRTCGSPIETAERVLGELLADRLDEPLALVAGTGMAGRMICQAIGARFVNEVLAQATAIRRVAPEVRSLLEIGGQDAKLIRLPETASDGGLIEHFVMNTNCAAGTGSFLDQQASRLGVRIEDEFGSLALASSAPTRVASRCSVFAKSDMIHLQQKATPLHDIVAGLCLGLARNLKSNMAGGGDLPGPIALCGGVAANVGVVKAIETVFELDEGSLVIPELHAFTGALGAVYATDGAPSASTGREILRRIRQAREQHRGGGDTLRPLGGKDHEGWDQSRHRAGSNGSVLGESEPETLDVWLGLDVGSISTKSAVIDQANRVVAKTYRMTAGRPLDAVKAAMEAIREQLEALPRRVRIRGTATTGSGRHLTADVIRADLAINEITAQAAAAAALDPMVDTIFEIGGQDSKYIALEQGVVVDFEMNHACAAGTGSFLEEQAERLAVSIKGQFGELALSSGSPVRLGERCTVFMESDLLWHQQQGAPVADLAAGLCYSVVRNYINRVVGPRRIGRRVFFQGGTAYNRGVVAAFEAVTGQRVTVPEHHEVTGAIGAAILARKHMQGRSESCFEGFALTRIPHATRSFECSGCPNSCDISEVKMPGRPTLYYGSRCDRHDRKQESGNGEAIADLFAERHRLLLEHARVPARPGAAGRLKIGVPLALMNLQLLPFWGTFLAELGVEMVLSPPSTRAMVDRGVEMAISASCFPVKVAHAHVMSLLEQGVDLLLIPSVVSLRADYPESDHHQACPYVSGFPYELKAALDSGGCPVRMLAPVVYLDKGPARVARDLRELGHSLGATAAQVSAAVRKGWSALDDFEEACRKRGEEALAALPASVRAVAIVSRAYNGCDATVSLGLAAKLRKLGAMPIPLDMLDLRDQSPGPDRLIREMYWKHGQRVLRAAHAIRRDPRLHAIYLSNFSCGPDSFLISYFRRIMAPKPSLVIETDEHSAGAGMVTRLEAFLESLRHSALPPVGEAPVLDRDAPLPADLLQRTVYLPWMSDVVRTAAAALRGHGIDARVMPRGDAESIAIGRSCCSGKECLPCLLTAGDMVGTATSKDFDRSRSAFFMPSGCGPCRFGQYHALHKLILSDLGLAEVPVLSPVLGSRFYDQWQQWLGNSSRVTWLAICIADVLGKARLASRPYELNHGETDQAYEQCLAESCDVLERRPGMAEARRLMESCAARMRRIAVDRTQQRPKIGVVGEIYIRLHDGANDALVRKLEAMGAEVDMASFTEYMYYTNWLRDQQARRDRDIRIWLQNLARYHLQRRAHRRLIKPFAGLVAEESETGGMLALAKACCNPAFAAGETVPSVGKAKEFCELGYGGVVNVMPFGCMPSAIADGLLRSPKLGIGRMPVLSIAYDGQQDPSIQTRLEAFFHQAREYSARARPGQSSRAVACRG